jgi:hypothetical protein
METKRQFAEQRAHDRRNVMLDVLLSYDSDQLTVPRLWKTRDLSPTGAFVEMRRIDLPSDAAIELSLVLEYNGAYETHRLPADIVRVSSEGVAVHFRPQAPRTRAALCHFLQVRESAY